MKKLLLTIAIVVLTTIPVLTFAQYSQPIGPNNVGAPQGYIPDGKLNEITDVNSLADKLVNIGNLITYLLIALAVVFIIWNVVIYMIRPAEEDHKKAMIAITYGIVGLFVILSLWGLVNILINTFGTNNRPPVERIPSVDFLR